MDKDEFMLNQINNAPKPAASRKKGGKVPASVAAQELIKNYGICKVEGQLYLTNEIPPEHGQDAIIGKVFENYQVSATKAFCAEVLFACDHSAPEKKQANPTKYIAFTNGILDVDTDNFPVDPNSIDGVVTTLIPHKYNPEAVTGEAADTLQHFISDIACADNERIDYLYEVLGAAISHDLRYAKMHEFIGTGSNGKSTYLALLENVVGSNNTAAYQPTECGTRFGAFGLIGKLLNISDDASSETIPKSATAFIKKAVTGDPVRVEEKCGPTSHTRLCCTMVMSANEPPKLKDTSYGALRRFHCVKFAADFSRDNTDYDMREKLQSEEVAEAAIMRAIEGLKRLAINKHFSNETESEALLSEIANDSNAALAFAKTLTREQILHTPTVLHWYEEYQAYCYDNGIKYEQSRRTVTRVINDRFKLTTEKNRRDPVTGKGIRTFVPLSRNENDANGTDIRR